MRSNEAHLHTSKTGSLPLGQIPEIIMGPETSSDGIPIDAYVDVKCPGIPSRRAELKITGNGSKGTILLTSGGSGTGFYNAHPDAGPWRAEFARLVNAGYRFVEIRWFPSGIWTFPADQQTGSRTMACRFAKVAVAVYKQLHQEGTLFAAQGNCGGSAQIAFSLCYYSLANILHLANLGSALPPCPRFRKENVEEPHITYEDRLEQLWCFLAAQGVSGTEWARVAEPILFDDPQLRYPNTIVRIFHGENEPNPPIIETGTAYFKAIRSRDKSIQVVKNTPHEIFSTLEGAEAMATAIREAAASLPP